jgi:preprotein translocase subunit YajC
LFCPFTFGSRFYSSVSNAFSWHLFFLKQKKRKKKTIEKKKKCKEGKKFSFKLPLYLLTFGSHFCPPTFALLFQTLSLGIFFFSNRRRKKKQKKKTIEKKKNVEKGRSFPLSSRFAFSLLPSRFCPSVSNTFSYHLLLLKQKEKNHRKEKNVEKGKSLFSSSHSALSLWLLLLALCFFPFISSVFSLASSSSQA